MIVNPTDMNNNSYYKFKLNKLEKGRELAVVLLDI
jgi:hypothetical protein